MTDLKKNGLIYESIINGFFCASWLMRQRAQIKGLEHLTRLPNQIIFAITHDSYFEIPALSKLYKAINPRPIFTVMAKEDFLSDRYLSTNFFKENPVLRRFLELIDRTGAPKAVFEKLNLISIPRPFADLHQTKYLNVRQQISSQFSKFKERIADGFSTLIFPEGTTWGYGGLRRIRSAVYQLVATSWEQHDKKIYILPVNVKVDKLVKGWKDVFINIGAPQFFIKSKEEFNQHLFQVLQRLHTITFSQVAAYHLRDLAHKRIAGETKIILEKVQWVEHLEIAIQKLRQKVSEGVLPAIDQKLAERPYFLDKVERFIGYCESYKYLKRLADRQTFHLNVAKVLSDHPLKQFRKKNPLAYHANELASLGEGIIKPAFD